MVKLVFETGSKRVRVNESTGQWVQGSKDQKRLFGFSGFFGLSGQLYLSGGSDLLRKWNLMLRIGREPSAGSLLVCLVYFVYLVRLVCTRASWGLKVMGSKSLFSLSGFFGCNRSRVIVGQIWDCPPHRNFF